MDIIEAALVCPIFFLKASYLLTEEIYSETVFDRSRKYAGAGATILTGAGAGF